MAVEDGSHHADDVSNAQIVEAASYHDKPASPHNCRLEASHPDRPIVLVGEAVIDHRAGTPEQIEGSGQGAEEPPPTVHRLDATDASPENGGQHEVDCRSCDGDKWAPDRAPEIHGREQRDVSRVGQTGETMTDGLMSDTGEQIGGHSDSAEGCRVVQDLGAHPCHRILDGVR